MFLTEGPACNTFNEPDRRTCIQYNAFNTFNEPVTRDHLSWETTIFVANGVVFQDRFYCNDLYNVFFVLVEIIFVAVSYFLSVCLGIRIKFTFFIHFLLYFFFFSEMCHITKVLGSLGMSRSDTCPLCHRITQNSTVSNPQQSDQCGTCQQSSTRDQTQVERGTVLFTMDNCGIQLRCP